MSRALAAGRPFETLQSAIRLGDFVPDTIPDIGLPVSGIGLPA